MGRASGEHRAAESRLFSKTTEKSDRQEVETHVVDGHNRLEARKLRESR